MNNAEYYGFNSNNGYFNFTKHIDHIPKKVKDDWGYYCEYAIVVMDDDEFCSSAERNE